MKRIIFALGLVMLFTMTAQAANIIVTWTAPGDDGDVGTASEYDIRYSLNTITDTNWDSASQVPGEPAPLISGTTQSMTITGFAESTVYFMAIKARDEAFNWSLMSNVVSVTTGDGTAPTAIVDFRSP